MYAILQPGKVLKLFDNAVHFPFPAVTFSATLYMHLTLKSYLYLNFYQKSFGKLNANKNKNIYFSCLLRNRLFFFYLDNNFSFILFFPNQIFMYIC